MSRDKLNSNAFRILNLRQMTISHLFMLLAVLWLVTSAVHAEQDIMLVLDNSGSMKKNDPEFLAKNAVRDFIESLDAKTRAGVIIFDQRVTLAVPLTQVNEQNTRLLTNSLNDINYRGQLTDSPAAVERAIYELKTKARDSAKQYIVFMTDGIVDTGNAAADIEKTKWLREELAVDAADNGIEVLAVAFTENADFFLIQSLAKKTAGEYFRALTPADLSGVFTAMRARIEAASGSPSAIDQAIAPDVSNRPASVEPQPAEAPAAEPTVQPPETPISSEPQVAVTETPTAPAATSSEIDDPLANISAEDLEALREISEIEGIPIEQLARELYGADDGGEANPGVVITRPGEPAVVLAEDNTSIVTLLIAAAALLLLLVIFVVWFIRRQKTGAVAPARDSLEAAASAPSFHVPAAFLHDISGLAQEPLVNLDENPLMVGRIAGNPDEHLKYLVVNAPTVGRRHAVIKFKDKAYWLVDQGSVNGTYLNDNRLSGEAQLRHGDRIRFHNAEFEFTQPDVADAGETMIGTAVIGADATIVADAATMMGVAPPAAGASQLGDELFADDPDLGDEKDLTLDGSDSDDYVVALEEQNPPPAELTSIDDVFDVTGEDVVPAVLEKEFGSEDDTAFNPESTALLPDDVIEDAIAAAGGESEVLDITQMPEGPAAHVTVAGDDIDHEFDAEASAFFDDITVGPVVDNDGEPVSSATGTIDTGDSGDDLFDDPSYASTPTSDAEQAALDEKLDRARQLAEAEGETESPATEHIDVAYMETMLNMEAPPQDDPNDLTLDDFIETSNFQAPKTTVPAARIDDEAPEDISLSQFVETSAFESDGAAETMILDDTPNQASGSRASSDEDGVEDLDDGSEDPTVFK